MDDLDEAVPHPEAVRVDEDNEDHRRLHPPEGLDDVPHEADRPEAAADHALKVSDASSTTSIGSL